MEHAVLAHTLDDGDVVQYPGTPEWWRVSSVTKERGSVIVRQRLFTGGISLVSVALPRHATVLVHVAGHVTEPAVQSARRRMSHV